MDSSFSVDNTLLFELPDSGGWSVNLTAIDSARVWTLIPEVFAARAPGQRAVMVWYNPRRPVAHHLLIDSVARLAGGRAFDAELSGWQQVPPPLPRRSNP